jgi:hypothetical protein
MVCRNQGENDMNKIKAAMLFAGPLLAAGCMGERAETIGTEVSAIQAGERSFSVDFTDCLEYVGQINVPYEEARALVPEEYTLVGDAESGAILSTRAVQCEGISVNGGEATPSILTQTGIGIESPDGTGFINTYLLWYTTNNHDLAVSLTRAGIRSHYVRHLEFTYTPDEGGAGGPFQVRNPHPAQPAYSIDGTLTEPSASDPGVFFVANWWEAGTHGEVLMQTVFPSLRIGGGSAILSTTQDSALRRLMGGGSVPFTVLNLSARFDSAHMEVVVSDP